MDASINLHSKKTEHEKPIAETAGTIAQAKPAAPLFTPETAGSIASNSSSSSSSGGGSFSAMA